MCLLACGTISQPPSLASSASLAGLRGLAASNSGIRAARVHGFRPCAPISPHIQNLPRLPHPRCLHEKRLSQLTVRFAGGCWTGPRRSVPVCALWVLRAHHDAQPGDPLPAAPPTLPGNRPDATDAGADAVPSRCRAAGVHGGSSTAARPSFHDATAADRDIQRHAAPSAAVPPRGASSGVD
jgi:hypothetical protein